jgi:hypothetical protein
MSLEEELDRELHDTYEAGRERHYIAHYFLQMLEEYGGLGTARRLLSNAEPQTGLYKMWELRLINKSLEAVVLKEKYRTLFTKEELTEARRRLDELNVNP